MLKTALCANFQYLNDVFPLVAGVTVLVDIAVKYGYRQRRVKHAF